MNVSTDSKSWYWTTSCPIAFYLDVFLSLVQVFYNFLETSFTFVSKVFNSFPYLHIILGMESEFSNFTVWVIDTVYFGLMETSQRDKIEYKYSIRTQNITMSLGKMFPENIICCKLPVYCLSSSLEKWFKLDWSSWSPT